MAYIRSDALVKELEENPFTMSICVTVDECKGMNRARSLIADVVKTIPAEDVQPVVHGKWIETEQPMEWDNVSCATCSVCGEDFVLDEWGIDDIRREMHYCMNCGARMDLFEKDADI